MSLVNLVRSAVFSAALGVGSIYGVGCDASSGSSQYCASDKDCKGDRLCVKGVCEGGAGSDVGGQTQYTCESGAQMFVDLCCPKAGCEGKTYMDFFSSCKDNEAAGKMNVQSVYGCLNNLCSSKPIVTRKEIELCYGFVDDGS